MRQAVIKAILSRIRKPKPLPALKPRWKAIRTANTILVTKNGEPYVTFVTHKGITAEQSYKLFCMNKGISPEESALPDYNDPMLSTHPAECDDAFDN